MYLNTAAPAEREPVNLLELQEVREHYLPPVLVRLCPLPEIQRRAEELSQEQPRLRQEARFVWREEVYRRARLAGSPLSLA